MSESRFGLTAVMHLVAARSSIVYYDMDSSLMLNEDPVTGGIEYKGGGRWLLGDRPGIGADFRESHLESMERAIIE